MYLKIVLLLAVSFATCSSLIAQPVDSAARARQKRYDYYWDIRNSRNTVGWVLLGSGLASFGVVALQNASANGNVDYLPSSIYGFALFGVAASLTSIPFFISAHDQKRKARLALKGEKISFGQSPLQNANYTALSFSISF